MRDPNYKRESRKYEHPIASREMIVEKMSSLGEPAAFKRLAKELELEDKRDRDALTLRLRAMVRDGQLVVDKRNVYALASKVELFAGKVSAHSDGYGFVLCEDERDDIFLTQRQMRAVFHGDQVLVRIRGRDRRGRDEGEIVEVLQHRTNELVGRVYFENRTALFEALNRRINHEILIDHPDRELLDGQIAVGKVSQQPSLHGLAAVEVIEILGEHLTPKMEVQVALRNHDIPVDFSDDVIQEVDQFPTEVKSQQKGNRADLRDLDFVTIDGEDARDFDDAVYCEMRQGGGYKLYVAIADVANYVRPDSDLDSEAYERGTSVYFPQFVVPMLPEKLSNGLCSLNPELDRLVMVCEMTIAKTGKISSYQFYEGVLRSAERLTYTQVGKWVEEKSFPRHADSLDALNEFTHTMLKSRQERGAIDFDGSEVRFSFGEDGRVKEVVPIQRNFAHKLIEEAMLCANVCAAKFIAQSGKQGLYRVHEKPEQDKIDFLAEFLATFGIELGEGTSFDYQRAVAGLRDKKNSQVLQISLLRSMQQAVYQPENKGHFGLSYSHYGHFTSPIRRYPDLLMHRLIKSVIHDAAENKHVVQFAKPSRKHLYNYDEETVVNQGVHLSFVERRADDAVYEVLEWAKCDFVSDRVGEDFAGIISAVTKFGFFVQLEGLLVDGLVHVSTLAGDYYHFEVKEQCLVGERSGQSFSLGDIVTVQVAKVDVDERKIDLELLTHSSITKRKGMKKKRKPKNDSRGPRKRKKKR